LLALAPLRLRASPRRKFAAAATRSLFAAADAHHFINSCRGAPLRTLAAAKVSLPYRWEGL